MLPHSKLLVQQRDQTIRKNKNETDRELHQQTHTQTVCKNASDEDESKNDHENENENVGFIEFEDLVINVSNRVNKKSIKNFQEMKESLAKLRQMETGNKKANIPNQLQCSNKNNNNSTAVSASTDQNFDAELLRYIVYSPIIEDNNRMPYLIRLVARKNKINTEV